SFTDAQALATAGTVSSTGGLTLTTTGAGSNLTLGGNLTASGQTVTLTSAGAIIEQPGGAITAGTLDVTAVGPVSLTAANAVGRLVFAVTGAGNSFMFRNDARNLIVG